MGIQKALFPSHALMPPRTADVWGFPPQLSHPEASRTERKCPSVPSAQLQTTAALNHVEPCVLGVTVCLQEPRRAPAHGVSWGAGWAADRKWALERAGLGFTLGPWGLGLGVHKEPSDVSKPLNLTSAKKGDPCLPHRFAPRPPRVAGPCAIGPSLCYTGLFYASPSRPS